MTKRHIGIAAAALALSAAAFQAHSQKAEEGRVATVKHIMNGIQKPCVGKLVGASRKAPATDKEWAEVEMSAALLNESAFLLLESGRAVDQVWTDSCNTLKTAAAAAAKAAAAKDQAALKTESNNIQATCASCHDVHKKS